MLGADTRATEGSIVCDKNCSKIHFLADNMYCCGAGTAADTMKVTDMVSSQLTLLKLNTGREVPVATANRILKQYLFKYQVGRIFRPLQRIPPLCGEVAIKLPVGQNGGRKTRFLDTVA